MLARSRPAGGGSRGVFRVSRSAMSGDTRLLLAHDGPVRRLSADGGDATFGGWANPLIGDAVWGVPFSFGDVQGAP